MTKKPKLVMLKGLPASGKTTIARDLVQFEGYVRVNKDDLRDMLDNGKFSRGNEKRVLDIRNYIVAESLEARNNVVVDDTNFDARHQEVLSRLAKENDADFEVVFIDTSLEECITRNEARADKVLTSVIMDMYNKYVRNHKNERPPYDETLEECIIVDVDGTLSHITGDSPRSVYDASRAMEDVLDDAASSVVSMAYQNGYKVIIFTGRHSGHIEVTKDWLKQNGINYDEIYCRQEGDSRKDYIVKEELYMEHIAGKYNVKYVIDDRPSVCRMWRKLGLPVLQVGDPHNEF